jgi:hypothetical protein
VVFEAILNRATGGSRVSPELIRTWAGSPPSCWRKIIRCATVRRELQADLNRSGGTPSLPGSYLYAAKGSQALWMTAIIPAAVVFLLLLVAVLLPHL